MDLRLVIVLSEARQELAGLPLVARQAVEAFLANLDVGLATGPIERMAKLLQRDGEGGFIARVDGAAVSLTLVPTSGKAIIKQVQRKS